MNEEYDPSNKLIGKSSRNIVWLLYESVLNLFFMDVAFEPDIIPKLSWNYKNEESI